MNYNNVVTDEFYSGSAGDLGNGPMWLTWMSIHLVLSYFKGGYLIRLNTDEMIVPTHRLVDLT